MIRKAKLEDIDEIKALTEACAAHMIQQGIYQWNEHYPSKNVFIKDVEIGQLYVLEERGRILGIIVLSDIEDEEYDGVKWSGDQGKKLYIHRLAVHPDFQGQGKARSLMDFAEDFAKSNNYISIRLDTFSQNPRNNKFYKSRGYNKLDDVYFPKQSEFPFHCYEKLVD